MEERTRFIVGGLLGVAAGGAVAAMVTRRQARSSPSGATQRSTAAQQYLRDARVSAQRLLTLPQRGNAHYHESLALRRLLSIFSSSPEFEMSSEDERSVLQFERENAELAQELARLSMIASDWGGLEEYFGGKLRHGAASPERMNFVARYLLGKPTKDDARIRRSMD